MSYQNHQKRLVNNAKNWVEMDGETMLEKRLNSLLTVSFLGHVDMPSDECLEYAINIIEMKDDPNANIPEYLYEIFNLRPSQVLLNNIDKIFVKWNKTKETSTTFQ